MTQKEALEILKTGRNVFLTGAAGSGKTFVLKKYIDYLKNLGANVGITASTGIAATHMGGTTVHSWCGIGIKDNLDRSDILEIADKQHIKSVVKNASVLIIDEISMLHHYRLDMIDMVLREIKKNDAPFGGLQVVFCGDFFQLPPIRKSYDPEAFFAYHSDAWKNLDLKICYLAEQHRQEDNQFLKILNAIRENRVNEEILEILKSRFNQKISFPTKLYSHNKNVDTENEAELEKIKGKIFEYKMYQKGSKHLAEILKKSCLAPENLKLKIGAKVMFVRNNFDEGYVNGTLGIVEKCDSEEIYVKTFSGQTIEAKRETWAIEEDGKIKAEISQFPLRLAWAITVHKSQGMSLDAAEIDLSNAFERGMGYVALSRVRSLNGLFLKGLNNMALKINDEVLEFDKKFRKLSETNSFHIKTMGKEKISRLHEEFAKKISSNTNDSSKGKKVKIDTIEETRKLLDEGLVVKEIAKKRGLKPETIIDHIEEIKSKEPNYKIYHLQNQISKNKFREIYGAFKKVGVTDGKYRLAPVKELLGPKYSYEELRIVRLFL